MSLPGMTVREFGVAPMADGLKNKAALEGYTVKYFKANLDELDEVVELQRLETRGLLGEEIVIIMREKFAFMDKYFIVIQYLEKTPE